MTDGDRPPVTLPRLGFVGLGVMGAPMSGHLAEAGYNVALFDIDAARARAVARRNTRMSPAPSLATLAEQSDIVVTMLPDGHVVNHVVSGPDGLAEHMAAGSLLVDTSSSQPWATLATAEVLDHQGVRMVDAPVSGAKWGAEAAELVFMVGGDDDQVGRAEPLFRVLGRAHFHLGRLGSGHAMKSINNTVTAITLQATLEGLILGVTAGLDPTAMNDVFNESTAGSWVTRNHIGPRVLSGSLNDPFRLALMRKDVEIAEQLAADHELDVQLIALAADGYRAADAARGDDASLSELCLWVQQRLGASRGLVSHN